MTSELKAAGSPAGATKVPASAISSVATAADAAQAGVESPVGSAVAAIPGGTGAADAPGEASPPEMPEVPVFETAGAAEVAPLAEVQTADTHGNPVKVPVSDPGKGRGMKYISPEFLEQHTKAEIRAVAYDRGYDIGLGGSATLRVRFLEAQSRDLRVEIGEAHA